MLKIRLQIIGRKNQPLFRLVVVPIEKKPKGKVKEILGWYNPRSKEGSFKKERINYWYSKGAKVSDTAWNLLIHKGILKGKKRSVRIRAKKQGEERLMKNEK